MPSEERGGDPGEEAKSLLRLWSGGGGEQEEVSDHQTTALALSERGDCGGGSGDGGPKGRIAHKDVAIRYRALAGAQARANPGGQLLGGGPCCDMANWRTLAFLVGVCYSIIAIGVAAASLGYRYDVGNDGYGFRALLEGTALLATVTFIASLSLIYGIMEKRSSFVSPWLVLQVVIPLYTAVFYFWAIFASGDKTIFGPVRTAVPISAMIAAIHILIMIGCVIIVNRYYMFLKMRESLNKKPGMEYE